MSGLPACVSLSEATVAYPISKEKTSATRIPQKYLSKRLTALSPKDSLYACTFEGCDHIFKQLASVYNHLHHLHFGVTVGCYYCSGRWWTLKGWSDHHAREHPLSDPYLSGTNLESLLVKKVQVGVTAESKAIFPTPVVDNLPEDESLSSTSIEEDEENGVPSVLSSLPWDVSPAAVDTEVATSSLGDFWGAHPRVPTSAIGSGHRKKALPHCSTHAWILCHPGF